MLSAAQVGEESGDRSIDMAVSEQRGRKVAKRLGVMYERFGAEGVSFSRRLPEYSGQLGFANELLLDLQKQNAAAVLSLHWDFERRKWEMQIDDNLLGQHETLPLAISQGYLRAAALGLI